MKIKRLLNGIEISGVSFNVKNTVECGQCFRFLKEEDGYLGVAFGKALFLKNTENGVFMDCTEDDFKNVWRNYFDLDFDYKSIGDALPKDGFTRAAVKFGEGLTIMRQEPWEALCSFIISQCNNIPRIQGIISRLCEKYGKKVCWQGKALYSFPAASDVASLTLDDLSYLRCGYRAPYILNAAQLVSSGELSFENITAMDTSAARKELLKINGIGPKVADCFLLFGLHKMDAFPVDTWMKKAAVYYGGKFEPELFGEYAGIAQQYIFYYARSGKAV